MATIPKQPTFTGASVPQNISETEAETGFSNSMPRQNSLLDTFVKGIPTLAVDAVDVTSASLGITERDQISSAVFSETPGLRDFLVRNRGALEGTTGIASILLSAIPATKVTKAEGVVGSAISKVPGLKKITELDSLLVKAKQRVRIADKTLARQGVSGKDAFDAAVNLKVFGGEMTRKQLVNRASRTGFARGATQGATAEALLYATQNENEFLYSDETATNVFLASIGVVLPGFIDNVATKSQIRRFLTDDKINRVAARAIDRGGFNELAEQALHERGEAGKIVAAHGADTDSATLHYLAADAKQAEQASDAGAQLFGKRQAAALEDQNRAEVFIDKVTRDGIPGTEGSGFTIGKGTSEKRIKQHLQALTKVDPTALYGAEFIGRIPSGTSPQQMQRAFDQTTDNMLVQVEQLIKEGSRESVQAAEKLANQYRFRKSLQPMVGRNMEMVPLEDTLGHVTEFKGEIIRESTGDLTLWKAENHPVGVTNKGLVILPGKKTVQDLSLEDAQALYASASKAIDSFVDGRKTLSLKSKPSWFELDMAEELIRRADDKGISASVVFPEGMTRESAMLESLAQKAEALKQRIKTSGDTITLREKLNLPKLTSYERGLAGTDDSAIDRLIKGVDDVNTIRTADLHSLRQTLADYRKATDLVEYTVEDVDLLGKSFKLGRDFKGNQIESFFVLRRTPGASFFSRTHFEERLANRQADVVASIASPSNNGTFVQRMTASLLNSADYKEAIATSKLSDVSMMGTMPFRGNRAGGTTLTSYDFAFRDHPTMLSAQRIQDNVSRESRAFLDSLLSTPTERLGGKSPSKVFADLRGRATEGSSQLLNQFISARRGWDLTEETISAEGKHTFSLLDTEKNRRRWRQFYGEDMPEKALLRHQDGTVVRVDDSALEGLKAFQVMADTIRKENNALLRAKGGSEIPKMSWYVPPRNFSRQLVQFIIDPNGNAVQTVAANTKSELNRLLKILQDDPNSLVNKQGFELISQKNVEKFTQLWDRAYTGLNDPTVPVVQSGAKNKGAGQSPFIEFNAWEEGLQSFQRQFNRLGNDVIEVNMRNQIDLAKARASAARDTATRKVGDRTIHDYYIQGLLGKNPLNDPGSAVGKVYQTGEDVANQGLETLDDFFHSLPLNPFSGGKRQAANLYKRLQSQIADDMPFSSANDFIEQRFQTRVPTTVRSLTGKMNEVTAGLVLRWGEMAHSILNITGMFNTSPAVINYFTPRVGESMEQFAKRVGHSSNIFTSESGPVATMDMGKIMQRAFKRAWKKDGMFSAEEWQFMKKRGYLNQEVAEFHRQLASIESVDDWTKVWKGDPNSKSWVKQKGADGLLAILSDKSEEFSRTYAHMVGLDIAENILGITSMEAKHTFAHDVANKVIANYNPLNRPEIFQGGLGAPIGLFQSYMFNYYQRLYRYIETKDARSAALMFTMQAGLFGMATVPGWREYNETYAWGEDGQTSPYDGLYKRFGRDVGDVVSAGVLSSLPKLFGAEGASLYTRGDTAPRLPGASPFPGLQVAMDIMKGFGRGIDMFRADHPGVTAQEVGEIVGHMLPNRPLSGIIDVSLGYSADNRGNIISNEVRDGMNAVYRVMGFKPMKEAKINEALWANRRENEMRLAKRQKLLRSGRAVIRSGNFDRIPKLAETYISQGGDPAYLRPWLQELLLTATTPKAERELMDIITNIDKMNQVNRLIDARIDE